MFFFCSNWDDAVDVLKKFQDIGATEVAIETGTNQDLIRLYAEKLLPHFPTITEHSNKCISISKIRLTFDIRPVISG